MYVRLSKLAESYLVPLRQILKIIKPKIFRLRRAFFENLGRQFYEIGRSKSGGVGPKTYFNPPSITYEEESCSNDHKSSDFQKVSTFGVEISMLIYF